MGVALKKRSRRSTISLSSSSSLSSSISCSSSLESNTFMKSILFTRRMALILAAVSFLSLVTLLYANSSSPLSVSPPLFYSFEIVKEFPHDETAFTQGLLFGGNDTFYESTGLYGKSSVRRVHLQTGKVLGIHHMDRSYFGEGLTLSGERSLIIFMQFTRGAFDWGKISLFLPALS